MNFFQPDLLAPVTYAIPTLACLFSTLTSRDGARQYDGSVVRLKYMLEHYLILRIVLEQVSSISREYYK
jgi:hypothetical protein